jgi:hypothetical protein
VSGHTLCFYSQILFLVACGVYKQHLKALASLLAICMQRGIVFGIVYKDFSLLSTYYYLCDHMLQINPSFAQYLLEVRRHDQA